ncbi:MAG TPA: hypothetical protein VK619_09685 [Pyrinomonadaceae bacterium]|nr:hypothetical protein [Pyrinomonadaceae bacterium]
MKSLRRFCAAVALSFALALSASAGVIDLPGSTPPSPPGSATTQGEIQIPGATANGIVSSDTIINVALSLLEGVLSF